MGMAVTSETVPALAGGTPTDDPFHDPLLIGIGSPRQCDRRGRRHRIEIGDDTLRFGRIVAAQVPHRRAVGALAATGDLYFLPTTRRRT